MPKFMIFDAATGEPACEDVYPNEKSAVDAEEDFGYDILEMGEEPLAMQVWEINDIGEKVRQVQLL